MLSLQSWWRVSTPADLRCGMDRLLLQVRSVLGRDPAEGEAYVFANRSGTRIKLLCCDRHGVWLAVRRLHRGRFVWPRPDAAAWTLPA
jgi:transposase